MHLPGEPEFLLHKDPQLFQSVKEALNEYDIPLLDIELARIRPDIDVNEYEPAFEAAAKLGATDILGSIWTRNRRFYQEQAGQISEMAAQYRLNYNIEFLPWAGVRNLQEGITLVDELNCDNLFLLVDILHAGRAGVTAFELARTNPKYFRYIHLCDGPACPDGDLVFADINDSFMIHTAREARLYPGDGVMDIAGMIRAMPNLPLSIELPNLENIKKFGAAGHARNCIDQAKAYFAAHDLD
jgi:sugar phosphate isomerase/epimerase